MATPSAVPNAGSPPGWSDNPSLGTWSIFVASFVVLLVIAIFAQVLTWKWRPWFPGAEGDRSMIEGVKAAVYTFMSFLA